MLLVRPQDAGQLGDVGFFDPAAAVAAAGDAAGLACAALADLASGVDGDLPGGLGHEADGGALTFASSHPTE